MTQWVYGFGGGRADGTAAMKALLGGKGANLAEMSNLGLPVPPGFTISTEVCAWFYAHGKTYPAELKEHVAQALAAIEQELGVRFGDPERPLAGLGPLRGAGLDAGHDGHGPQPRPQRPARSRAWPPPAATPASPTTAIAASSRCTATSCWSVDHYQFEEALEDAKQDQGVPVRHRPRRRDAGRAGRRATRRSSPRPPASRSRRTRRSSSGVRSAPCSARG